MTPAAAPTPPPAGWSVQVISGLDIRLAIPGDWQEMPVPSMRDQLSSLETRMTGEVRRGFQAMLDLLDSGRVRFVALGPRYVSGQYSTATAMLIVDSGDASLDAAVARLKQEPILAGRTTTHEEVDVRLPIGRARRIAATASPSGGIPALGIAYIVFLTDGTTLSLMCSSRDVDITFKDLAMTMAQSLSR